MTAEGLALHMTYNPTFTPRLRDHGGKGDRNYLSVDIPWLLSMNSEAVATCTKLGLSTDYHQCGRVQRSHLSLGS